MKTFYLGIHELTWIGKTTAPLFISRRRLDRRKRMPLPRAVGPYALDLGGFTELALYGAWQTSEQTCIDDARRCAREIGPMDFLPPRDWMCEPFMLAKTGKTIPEHQKLTVESYLSLRKQAPELPWAPVLQGWELADYLHHVELYEAAGVDLWADSVPVVGVGSICRRQGTEEAAQILGALASLGLKLHGFGVKLEGLGKVAALLHSADSMAWSYAARKAPPMPTHTHVSCANCLDFAQIWRDGAIDTIEHGEQRGSQLAMPLWRAA